MTEDEKAEFDNLRYVVECLMIAREGIQELDGTTTQIYEEAESYLKRRTMRLRNRKQMEKEKLEVEYKIRELQDTLKHYEECLG